ncbi:MAG: hypothetical protein KDA88_18590 [Planctomycetaceae bacterium]|nr:hypothetical protein [Planctomycetaceae bacterium]MCB9953234.1 hypothetical protein [Planctomycetaceae bacterium]
MVDIQRTVRRMMEVGGRIGMLMVVMHITTLADDIPAPTLPTPAALPTLNDDTTEGTQVLERKRAKLQELQMQMQQLRQRVEAMKVRAPEPSVPELPAAPLSPPVERPTPQPTLIPPVPMPLEQYLDQPPKNEIPPSETEKSPPQDMVIGTSSPDAVLPNDVLNDSSINGEIDRISLASSLFATGQHAECLQVLQQLKEESLSPDDIIWRRYLTACCHRGIGEYKEAARLYREIVGRPDSDWTRELAKWWLDHLRERNELTARSQQLQAGMNQRTETANEDFKQ